MADNFSELLLQLRLGERVSDTQFDKLFPADLRKQARTHWTEVAVALEAIKWLSAEKAEAKILDIGSNVGKFCMVAALASRAHLSGVEKRRDLVDIARQVSRQFKIERVRFQWADMNDVDWSVFDGIYLFNPFHEQIDSKIRLDAAMEFSEENFAAYVRGVQDKLSSCAPHTRVATYYGFGGEMPARYQRHHESPSKGQLEFWVKF